MNVANIDLGFRVRKADHLTEFHFPHSLWYVHSLYPRWPDCSTIYFLDDANFVNDSSIICKN